LIEYPRRSFIRRVLKTLAKLLVRLLIEVKVEGEENFPKTGPYIVIGNHVSSLEPILMVIFTPHQLEYLGSGDIPIDPRMSFIANLYKFIPIMRGQIDQKGLISALEVLLQNGVLGIFPEGGIWEKNLKEPKIGLSWISYKSKASIVPIGFTGMNGALIKALQFKRPKVLVKIGNLLTYDEIFPNYVSLKTTMNIGAEKIMEKIAELLPSEDINNPVQTFPKELIFNFIGDNGIEERFEFAEQNYVSRMLEHPVIMDVFMRNLKLPVKVLTTRDKRVELNEVNIGINAIINYLGSNPGFLTYRFGVESGLKMLNGLQELIKILHNNKGNNRFLIVRIKDK